MLKEELEKDSTKIYLQVENPEESDAQIDLVNVMSAMGKRRKPYFYLGVLAACVGVCLGLLLTGADYLLGKSSYARAVVSFQYQGVEEGLDPNGASFDINKIKSPAVIEDALTKLGMTDISTEDIRQNIMIEGVVPEDAVERITVIKEMAMEDASNYEKILDVTYFPTQYVVYLYKDKHIKAEETTQILNAILESYRDYFMDTYANTEVLTVTGNLIDYEEYDYAEAIDVFTSQIEIMRNYVGERRRQAPDFRSVNTGLSFGDIAASLEMIEDIDLANLTSYVENTTLSKDRERMAEYYNYKIRKYNMTLTELQTQLATVQNTIDTYTKDPVVIVSSQESTQEITKTNEYYDSLIGQKLELNKQIAGINTKLNEAYELLNRLNEATGRNTQKQYDYADDSLAKIAATVAKWVELTEETTEEYYATTLFSNAYKIAVPASYQAAGGIAAVAKKILICMAVLIFIVVVCWCVDGLRTELAIMRKKAAKEGNKSEKKV